MNFLLKLKNFSLCLLLIILTISVLSSQKVLASTTDGTITSPDNFAYGENVGWVDFGTTGGNVHITDPALTGYAYGENKGWLSLNCSNTSSCGTVDYKVSNDAEGNLSGFAWGENIGWVDFGNVSINSSGEFSGYVYGENIGWISMDCSNTSSCGTVDYGLITDWRPASTRSSGSGGGSHHHSGGGGSSTTTNPPTTSPQTPPTAEGCLPGDLFSQTTGGACLLPSTTPIPGCFLGYLYSSTTGVKCPVLSLITPPITSTFVFTQTLTVGSTGLEVKALQIYLNTHGFPVAITGVGSLGNETNYFGQLTRLALSKFQAAHGISPAVGFFGPITRAFINSH